MNSSTDPQSRSSKSVLTVGLAALAAVLIVAAIAVVLLPDHDLPGWLLKFLGREPALPVCDVKIGNTTFEVEIANTEAIRQTGLMRRDSMPADHGMIFVFKTTEPLYFWMKNTRIPLDLVYLDANANIISILHMQPYVTSPTYDSNTPAKWAIELNLNAADTAGAKPGDHLDLPKEAQDAAD